MISENLFSIYHNEKGMVSFAVNENQFYDEQFFQKYEVDFKNYLQVLPIAFDGKRPKYCFIVKKREILLLSVLTRNEM